MSDFRALLSLHIWGPLFLGEPTKPMIGGSCLDDYNKPILIYSVQSPKACSEYKYRGLSRIATEAVYISPKSCLMYSQEYMPVNSRC